MTIPVLCFVILLQLFWIFLLKTQIEKIKLEIAVKYPSYDSVTDGAQKGMRSFKIGR